MLRRNLNGCHFGIRRSFDAAMKHKIRNLRAKLKNFLSSQSCTKNSKRCKQVKRIQQLQNKQFLTTNFFFNTQKHLFTHTKLQPKQLWYQNRQKCNVMYAFGKLTEEEIEQIKEDLVYYLGEEHVQKFKEFLEIKNRIKNKETKENFVSPTRKIKKLEDQDVQSQRLSIQKRRQSEVDKRQSTNLKSLLKNKKCSVADRFFGARQLIQTNQSDQTQTQSNKRLKTVNLMQSRTSTTTKTSVQKQRAKFQVNLLGNRQNFQKNRKLIEEYQNANRLLSIVSLQMKKQKALDIFKMMQQAFLSTIKQKNTQNQTKTKNILNQRHKKNVTFGSIVELNEELRKIYIKKISQNKGTGLRKIAQESIVDKEKHKTTLGNFFASENPNYKSRC